MAGFVRIMPLRAAAMPSSLQAGNPMRAILTPSNSLKLLVLTVSAAFIAAAGSAPAWASGSGAKAPAARTADARGKHPARPVRTSIRKPSGKTVVKSAAAARPAKAVKTVRRSARPRAGRLPSQATLAGLRKTDDPLHLGSSVAYVLDQDTGEELLAKNAGVQLPIASVTKLMTALVIAESGLSLREKVRITREDYVRSTASSKMRSGMVLTREALLKAALMSSDNRAAHALARSYPGGRRAFIARMNEQAAALGMSDSFFADPTGLDDRNHSTARDLGKLVAAASGHRAIREASTKAFASISTGRRTVNLSTTNRLIGDPSWRIGVQKTGFTTAAGRCMVVQSEVGERRLVMVVLDSPNNARRADDMRAMRAYVAAGDAFERDFSSVAPYAIF